MAQPDHSQTAGGAMAAAIDVEATKLRDFQQQYKLLRADLEVVMGQEAENQLVLAELQHIDKEAEPLYKMVGPVLIRKEYQEVHETVEKRLEFIATQKSELQRKCKANEEKQATLTKQIQQMQSQLQQATAQAVQAVAQHHQTQSE